MVDALMEAQRVLKRGGILIDLRPIARDAPLEVVFDEKVIPVGLIDGSKGKIHDAATDRALATVARSFLEIGKRNYKVSVNYNSLDETMERLAESSRHAQLSSRVIGKIKKITNQEKIHLRYYEHVRLTCYRVV